MNQSDNDLKKVFKTLNNAFIQMYLNDKKIQLNKAVDKEFIDILSNDLDFPNAIKHI
jgi:cysteinyl-tRNA synthetase